jgi:hypothetical protein
MSALELSLEFSIRVLGRIMRLVVAFTCAIFDLRCRNVSVCVEVVFLLLVRNRSHIGRAKDWVVLGEAWRSLGWDDGSADLLTEKTTTGTTSSPVVYIAAQ